jgi:hypothetical protein
VRKDTVLLPPLYAGAEIPEHWLVDARGELRFEVFPLRDDTYAAVPPARESLAQCLLHFFESQVQSWQVP